MTKRLYKLTSAALILPTALLISTSPVAHASPAGAEATARSIASKLSGTGFQVQPIGMGLAAKGQTKTLFLNIEPGVDYSIVVGGDREATDIDMMIYGEYGQLIGQDINSHPIHGKNAGVTFRATYGGRVQVHIIMRSLRAAIPPKFGVAAVPAATLGSFALLQGSRQGMAMPWASGGP